MDEYILPEKDYYTMPENCDFDAVIQSGFGRRAEWGALRGNSCTPDLKIFQVGLAINAPHELVFPNHTPKSRGRNILPVTGTLVHDVSNRLDIGDFDESMVFVVVDSQTSEIWSGRIPPNPNAIVEPVKHAPPEKGVSVGGEFTVNLLRICGMPLYETEYIVYVTVGPYKSNVVTINVTERK